MNNKTIRILSPLTILGVLLLDISVVLVTIFAIQKLKEGITGLSIVFLIMVLFAIVIGVLVSKEIVSNKIIFSDEGFELIGLDNDNKYNYCDIEKVNYNIDEKLSFKKNFNDRHAIVILSLKQNKVASIDLGLITKKKLLLIVNEIDKRISK